MRLIDADACANKVANLVEIEWGWEGIKEEIKRIFEECAAVDPVRHGKWISMGGFMACSECGCSPAFCEPKPNNPQGFPPYCYGCGAKMDLTEVENAD